MSSLYGRYPQTQTHTQNLTFSHSFRPQWGGTTRQKCEPAYSGRIESKKPELPQPIYYPPGCLCVSSISTHELVWVCISQEVCLPRERERSHEHTARSIPKVNHFSILPSQVVMSQNKWEKKRGETVESKKMVETVAEKFSITIYRTPLVSFLVNHAA